MTDRELLELAAKAAEIALVWCDKIDSGICYEHISDHPRPHWGHAEYPHQEWNPLTDDGDAFRLAIKLDMRVSVNQVDWAGNAYVGALVFDEKNGPDAYTATRRAIVMAAAHIGGQLK